jgi:hypothetical protein
VTSPIIVTVETLAIDILGKYNIKISRALNASSLEFLTSIKRFITSYLSPVFNASPGLLVLNHR